MKKKIVFMVINMNVGGTEKALLNMIASMPKEKYAITILMLEEYGGFLNSIPSGVHIEYVNEYPQLKEMINKPPKEMITEQLKRRKYLLAVKLTFVYMAAKLMNNRAILFKYLLKNVPMTETEYDMAVAYAGPMDFISYFVMERIKAKRKLQWIHFDITKIGLNHGFAKRYYRLFDKLYVVSLEGKQKLLKQFPQLANKVDVFTNIVSPDQINRQANSGMGFQDQFSGLRIVTVGRLSKEKGQDLAISVLVKLMKSGCNVKWYCIGEGNARTEYEQLIKKHGIEKNFILLGAMPNPYPFIKEADIYVQPSKHEGFCITLTEAKILRKPIVTTNFTGATEQIKDKKTGFIVDMQTDAIYRAVKKLINYPQQRQDFSMNLAKEAFESPSEKELYHLI